MELWICIEQPNQVWDHQLKVLIVRNTPTKVPNDKLILILLDDTFLKVFQRHIRRLDHLIRSGIAVDEDITGGVLLQFITQLRCSRYNVITKLECFAHAIYSIVVELLVGLVHLLDVFDTVGVRLIDDKIIDIKKAGLVEELRLLNKLPHRLCHWATKEDEATIIFEVIQRKPIIKHTLHR